MSTVHKEPPSKKYKRGAWNCGCCGKIILEIWQYCPLCGTKIDWDHKEVWLD